MSELESYAKLFALTSLCCIIYEVTTGKELTGTWPLLIILNVYIAAMILLQGLKTTKE